MVDDDGDDDDDHHHLGFLPTNPIFFYLVLDSTIYRSVIVFKFSSELNLVAEVPVPYLY
eukprot:SAG31_NODE_1274_length_9050_cov_10.910178_7_plen_59_part_00